jgi:hypothetical protein
VLVTIQLSLVREMDICWLRLACAVRIETDRANDWPDIALSGPSVAFLMSRLDVHCAE